MNKEEIHGIFDSFSKLKALVIGDVMIDKYVWGKVTRISPEAPVPIVSVHKEENRLGGAANVALNIQALGATPLLCSVTGNDERSKLFSKLLEESGLASGGILKSEQRITTVKTRIIGSNQQVLRVDEEMEDALSASETDDLVKKIGQVVETEKINVIIFEDYDKGVITPRLIEEVVALAGKKGIPVAVDPKKKNFLDYKEVTLFKPNLKELAEGLKRDLNPANLSDIKDAVDHIRNSQSVDTVLVTLSEKGMLVSNDNAHELIPAHIRNVADVSGAGDTVISVAALCVALNLSATTIANLANLAGGLVCETVGVAPIVKTQLKEEALLLSE